jgi:RNA polymerase sigma-70 factor (ECF subfamily)
VAVGERNRAVGTYREAFAQLVRQYQAQVLGLCYRMTGSRKDAADVAQQVFLQAYRHLHTHDTSQPFRPWLLKIATNECISFLRRSGRHKTVADEEALDRAVDTEPDAPSLLELADDREAVRRAVAALPLPYRAVILQHYFEGLSYQQIAEREALEAHLERCSECNLTLARLAAEDDFLTDALALDARERAWVESTDLVAPVMAQVAPRSQTAPVLLSSLLILLAGYLAGSVWRAGSGLLPNVHSVGGAINLFRTLAPRLFDLFAWLARGGLLTNIWPLLALGALYSFWRITRTKETNHYA